MARDIPRQEGKENGPRPKAGAGQKLPAAPYSPTRLPAQYHRRRGA